ncbi:ABC transporter ATP-binding protein [Enterococcus sp. HY326]|uniref:ABC transporter ATP-binding protein n=1 Tax=Enterococcus sp. HY326 TaxID=2971265 RepID=UPI00223F335A|nr:ABC transporter ATP-binding protein [Enterococcus sp. HY326]
MYLLKEFSKKNKGLLAISIFFITITTFATLIIPFLVAHMINEGILLKDAGMVTKVSIQMVFILILGTLAGILGSYFSADFSAKFAKENRQQLSRSIQKLSIKQVDDVGVASLVTRMTNDNVNAQQIILTFLQLILPSPIMSIFSLILTIQINPLLALIPLFSIVIFGAAIYVTMSRSVENIIQIQIKIDRMTLVLREFFTGVRIIRAFDNSHKEQERSNKTFESYTDNNIAINKHFAILTPLAFSLMVIVMALIIWFGSQLVSQNALAVGSITALVEYTVTTISTLITSALVLFQFPKGIASIKRISEIITMESSISDQKDQADGVKKLAKTAGVSIQQLEFKQVDFRYTGAEESVLTDINFSIRAGETLAIVGGTGSGKSSLLKVLLRLEDTTGGEILVNNINTRKLPLKELRKKIAYIPQKAFLFSGTIKDSLQFSNQDLAMDKIIEVAKVAQAHDFITSPAEQFNAPVAQGGTNFSGGQKQRLAIARGLAKEADIYIFDDSFSALDYETDAKLRHQLKSYLKNKIAIIVAQRLSTIAAADKIVVLNEGQIVGVGQHKQLLHENKYYRELALTQGLITDGGKKNVV